MTMASNPPIAGILSEMKWNLDLAYTYVFLEMAGQNESTGVFSHALNCLKEFSKNEACWQLYRDAVTRLLFLMVKLPPNFEDPLIRHF